MKKNYIIALLVICMIFAVACGQKETVGIQKTEKESSMVMGETTEKTGSEAAGNFELETVAGLEPDIIAGMANPWELTDEQGMKDDMGMYINVPAGAENVIYSILRKENLGQVSFSLEGREFNARIQPQAEMTDISGVYAKWDTAQELFVNDLPAKILISHGTDISYSVCLWMDMAPGIAYSLSTSGKDIDDVDLLSLAEEIYVPMQGES